MRSVLLGVVVLSFFPASGIKLLSYVLFGKHGKLKSPSLDCSKGEKKKKQTNQPQAPRE